MDFVLTSDLDWASEYCIEHFLEVAGQYLIKPTFFVTHESAAVRRASEEGHVELGIHPNFLPGSSHGDDIKSVINHVLHLVPHPIAVRCHRYFDSPQIAAVLANRGLKLDSNLCMHLERNLGAHILASGLLRLPVFFEDDIHWDHGLEWRLDVYAADFLSPGLKTSEFSPVFCRAECARCDILRAPKIAIGSLTRNRLWKFVIVVQGPAHSWSTL